MTTTVRTFKSDYEGGIAAEYDVMPVLETYFDEVLLKLPPKHPFDMMGPGGFFEHKRRYFNASKYPTTIVPYSKVLYAEKATAPCTFCFTFDDGTYFIHYNPEQFKTYDVLDFQRRPRPDHYDRKQLYCYIPVADLIKIETTK